MSASKPGLFVGLPFGGSAALAAAVAAPSILWQHMSTGDRSMWLMNGTSWTGSSLSLPQVPVVWSIAGSGDFNADGNADLVWQNTTTGERSIWFMNGNTWGGQAALLPQVPTAWSIAGVGDFNSDGKPDLVWQNSQTGERSIWFMNGSTFSGAVLLPTVPVEWKIAAVGDFNADGKPDLVWQDTITGQRSIWFMNGSTYVGAALLSTVPTNWKIVAAADFNADGKPDLLWQNTVTGERSIWLMNGSTYTSAVILQTVAPQWSIAGVFASPPPLPPPPPAWTLCVQAGNVCEYIGLRDVRLGAANGPYVQQTAYHLVPCATYGFNGQDPAPGQNLHCDIGPIKTRMLNNPVPGMAGMPAIVTVGLGSPGSSLALSRATGDRPVYTDGSGSFRTLCSPTNFAFDDPIVFPGQPGASHLHVFFGNAGINANSTPTTVAGSGNSSCKGGILNRTGYWAPAVFDTRSGEVQIPDEGVFYYKTGYNIDPTVVTPFPAGLRMVAGNKTATGPQNFVDWYCRDSGGSAGGAIPTSCAIGDAIRLDIQFPQCWDGVNLDSPDHKSHMSYPDYRNPPLRSTCPASHPVTLPAITEHFDYPITSSSAPAFWRLSSDMYASTIKGGFSAHADWMNGWDPATMNTIVTQCLNKAVDCGVGSIGNGVELYQPQQ